MSADARIGREPPRSTLRRLAGQVMALAIPLALAVAVSLGASAMSRTSTKYYIGLVGGCFAAMLAAVDLRRVTYLLILLLPIESIGPIGLMTTKVAKLGVMLVVLAVEVGRRAIQRDLKWKRSPFDGFIVVFLTFGVLSSVLSIAPTSSLRSVVQSALIFGFFTVIVNRVDSGRRVRWLIGAMLIVAGAVAVYGVLQKVFGVGVFGSDYIRYKIARFYFVVGNRLFSVMNNPNALGGYMGTMLPIAMAYLALGKFSTRKRWLLVILCALMLANVVLASSRGAMVGVALATAMLVLLLRRNRYSAIVLGVVLVLLLVILALTNLPAVESRLRLFSSADITLAGRPEIWRIAVRLGFDHLPFGIGYYTWETIYPTYGTTLWTTVDDAHNLLLNMFVELGIPGIVLFFWFVVTLLKSSMRLVRKTRFNPTWYPFAVGMLGAGLSRLAHETVEADTLLGVSSVVQVFWVLLALQVVVSRIVARESSEKAVTADGGSSG